MRATGCNQCWYSPFTGDPHEQVWGVYPFIAFDLALKKFATIVMSYLRNKKLFFFSYAAAWTNAHYSEHL
jgi:hypothetical protein